jgi:hypothetical protein
MKMINPNTDEPLGEDNVISIKGVAYGIGYDETYSIHTEYGDKLVFAGYYANIGSDTTTSDATVEFSVLGATGKFVRAYKVDVKYTSNEFKSRIITIYYR